MIRYGKGRNFRLSDMQMADLDSLVKHFGETRSLGLHRTFPNRTDVIRYLIQKEITRLEVEAAGKLEAESKPKKKAPSAISRRKTDVIRRKTG